MPGKERIRTISLRVTPAEYAALDAARQVAGRGRMGAWVRDVVLSAIGADARPAVRAAVPEINEAAYRQLIAATNNINQVARQANMAGRPVPGTDEALAEIGAAARMLRGL